MRSKLFVLTAAVLALASAACESTGKTHEPPMAKAKAAYSISGDQAEGCECESVCPCVFTHDVTFADCRGLMVWHVTEGTYGKTNLSGVNFAVALTKSGKNVVKAMGSWEGVIYVSSAATKEQKDAVVDILASNWGKAFAKIDVKSVPIEFRKIGEERETAVGEIAVLKTAPLKGSDGKVPAIENAPFKLIPKLYCATSTVNTYKDGADKTWDFKGRNAFYGPFEYRSE
jgi:hypothetical protein